MERSLTSTTVRKAWTATQSGWNLTFTLETGNNTTIYCNGIKPTEGQTAPVPAPASSASLNAQMNPANNTSTVNFNGIAHDSTLAAAIITEMETILTEEAI